MKRFNQQIKRSGYWAVVLAMLLLVIGCDQNATSPETDKLQLSKGSQAGLSGSWEAYHSLKTINDIGSIMSGDIIREDDSLDLTTTTGQVQSKFNRMKADVVEMARTNQSVLGQDSLIFFVDTTNPVTGMSVRKALYYNSQTGKARYYKTIYQFPSQVQIKYDSTEIRADLNFTLLNTSDDRLLSIYQLTEFKTGFYLEKKEGRATVTDYGPNNEVTGATLHNEVFYGSQGNLEKLTQDFEINPDASGSIAARLDYRDNTFLERNVNLYADYTGDFSETWRNGTTVNGTFDRVEDDNHGSFQKTINFTAGHFLQKLEQAAEITLHPADSTQAIMLAENRYFTNGRVDSCRLDYEEFYETGLKKTLLKSWKNDGTSAELLVTHYSEFDDVEGFFIGTAAYYNRILATFYSDGSGDLTLKVYQSEEAYQNGDPPLLTIHLHFNPDGSGEGNLAENDEDYQVQVSQDGNITVVDNEGRSESMAGY